MTSEGIFMKLNDERRHLKNEMTREGIFDENFFSENWMDAVTSFSKFSAAEKKFKIMILLSHTTHLH
jgi:hypothetical protein